MKSIRDILRNKGHPNLQFQIGLEWKEPRATYQNLKERSYLNALSSDDINRLWLPLVVYTNTDQQETTRLGVDWEWSTNVLVKREGQFVRSGYEVLDEIEIFKGEENSLSMVQSYTHVGVEQNRKQRFPVNSITS